MKILRYILGLGLLLTAACAEDDKTLPEEPHAFTVTSDIIPFAGEEATRVNLDGTGFESGDWIRLKVICPFSTNTEIAESTSGTSYDGFWLMKYTSGAQPWTPLTAADGCDIDGDYGNSSASSIFSRQPAQATPYVFTASTWTEEVSFLAGGSRILNYSNVFHTDQTLLRDYKAADVLWAQQYMETGCWNVHLDFHHVMSALLVTVDTGSTGFDLDGAVVTVEGLPEIDQQEIIVGDYYAAKSKVNSTSYGYRNKHACTVAQNGKVLGIGVNAGGSASCRSFATIANTATYTAHHVSPSGNVFRVIVPPVTLGDAPVIWIRSADGRNRYKFTCPVTTFEQGCLYPFNMQLAD